jgi:ABC-type amino acid transport substrate-binding protein
MGSGAQSGLLLADAYLSMEPYALALRRGDEDFRLAVDRALSQIYRSGEIGGVFAASFGPAAKPSQLLLGLYTTSALPE